jgi:hypothetical protein
LVEETRPACIPHFGFERLPDICRSRAWSSRKLHLFSLFARSSRGQLVVSVAAARFDPYPLNVETHLDNPDFWRARADEARAQAEQMRDRNARQALLGVANVYEKLAKDAEEYIKARKLSG